MKIRFSLISLIIILNSLVLISPLLTFNKIYNNDELSQVSFGFPIPFVIQNMSHRGPQPPLPYNMTFSSPWENPTTINKSAFVSSIAIASVIAVLLNKIPVLKNRRYNK